MAEKKVIIIGAGLAGLATGTGALLGHGQNDALAGQKIEILRWTLQFVGMDMLPSLSFSKAVLWMIASVNATRNGRCSNRWCGNDGCCDPLYLLPLHL
jgi:hypothetical protein